MEVEGGSCDNSELPPLRPSKGACRADLPRAGAGEKSHTHGPQDRPSLQAPSSPSEFIEAFINQEGSSRGLGLQPLLRTHEI